MKVTYKSFFLTLFMLTFIMTGNSCSSESESQEEEIIPPVEEDKEFTIRVLTYNIFHGETTNGSINMDLFAEIINKQNPDLVALQEVDKGVERSGRIDITQELSDRTGMEGHFFKFRNFQGGDYGNAILSKLPVVESDYITGYKEGAYGVVIPFAKIQLDDDTHIFFNSSHLSTVFEERETHTRQLAAYYETELNKAPLIIAGDLNATPESPEMEILFKSFVESDSTLSNTFSTRTGMRSKIDYILYPKNDNWEVIETKRICRVDASDHCAFLSVLRFKKS